MLSQEIDVSEVFQAMASTLMAFLKLVAMLFVTSSVLVPSSKARSP